MKTLKAICTATILALALSVSAYAGEISSPGSPCTDGGGTSSTPGDISSPASAETAPVNVGFPPTLAEILTDLIWLF